MGGRGALAALVVAALAAPALASAQEPDFGIAELVALTPAITGESPAIPLTISGKLTVEFHGDAAAGCAITGVCGFAGSITWAPERTGELAVFEYGSRRRRQLTVTLEPGAQSVTTARVTRRGADGSTGRCSDVRHSPSGVSITRTTPGRGVRLSVPGTTSAAALGGDVLATRCAAPRQSDLRGSLPVATLSAAALRRGRATIDLRGSRPFAGHGFAGTVHSTITARIGRPGDGSDARPRGRTRFRVLTARYAIERVDGGVTTSLAGSNDPSVCGPIDACGVTGTITSAPGQIRDGEVMMTASAERRRGWRDLRAAIGLTRRGNGRGVLVMGFGAWEGGPDSATTASIQHPGTGPPCADRASPARAFLFLAGQNRMLRADYVSEPDPLRTRCPGPRLPDVFGDDESIADGTGSIRRLAGRRPVLRLTGDRPFGAAGYTGRVRADLTVHLRRIRITRGTVVG